MDARSGARASSPAPGGADSLPTGSRRYSRLETCATRRQMRFWRCVSGILNWLFWDPGGWPFPAGNTRREKSAPERKIFLLKKLFTLSVVGNICRRRKDSKNGRPRFCHRPALWPKPEAGEDWPFRFHPNPHRLLERYCCRSRLPPSSRPPRWRSRKRGSGHRTTAIPRSNSICGRLGR